MTYGFVVRHSIQLSYGRLWNGGYLAKSEVIGKRKTGIPKKTLWVEGGNSKEEAGGMGPLLYQRRGAS